MTDVDAVMRVLAEDRRRRLLLALREEEQGVPIDPFAEAGDGRSDAIQLRHVHLPLLEDTGLVAWDREAGTVRRGEDFEAVVPLLAVLEAGRHALPDSARQKEGQTC